MSLLVYNLTAAPLVLANGLGTTIPASTVGAGARGLPWYASGGELEGRSPAEYAALQAQVDAGEAAYAWQDAPEYNIYPLEASVAQNDVADEDVFLYVDPTTGDDDTNPGTQAAPFATISRAFAALPLAWRKRCQINLAAGSYPGLGEKSVGQPVGEGSAPFAIVGTMVDAKTNPGDTSLLNLTSIAPSTDTSYVANVAIAPADGALRGAFLKNLTTDESMLVINNVTVLGVMTTTLLGSISSMTVGDLFSIERPGSILESGLDVMAIHGPSTLVALKDLKIKATAANPGAPLWVFAENSFYFVQGVDIDFNGIANRGILCVHTGRLAGGTLQGSAPFTFSPFADLYLHQSVGAGVVTMFDKASVHLTGSVMDRARYNAQGFSSVLLETVDGKNSNATGIESTIILVGHVFSGLTPGGGTFDGAPANGAGVGVIGGTDGCFVKIGNAPSPLNINNVLAPSVPVRIRQQSNAWIGALGGVGNTGVAGIVVEQISTARLNTLGPGSTTITAAADVSVGGVTRSYAQLPFSQTEVESLATGAAAAIGATNNVTGLTGMTLADVGNLLAITGSATPANNNTHLIIQFVSATEVVVASVLVADAGPVSWTLQSQRPTGNRAQ